MRAFHGNTKKRLTMLLIKNDENDDLKNLKTENNNSGFFPVMEVMVMLGLLKPRPHVYVLGFILL